MDGPDIAAIVLRIALGGTMIAHGWNHAFGGGKLPGTAKWFESIGIRPGRVHALFATVTELGAGAMLLLGLATPLAAAAVVGSMTVALIANHIRNGFFIFRPGEGYEYVLNLILAACALGALGGGAFSVDGALGLDISGLPGFTIALVAGGSGAGLLLLTSWRPARPATSLTAKVGNP